MNYKRCRIFLILLAAMAAHGQEQNQPQNPTLPTITFDVFWEASTPQSYTITVDSLGKARYVSRSPTRPEDKAQPNDDDYQIEFTFSAANRDRLFELAKEANYFHGDFDYKQHAIANTGRKILGYADAVRNFTTTYNWSENKAIEEITRIFQGTSSTLQHGRRLQFMRRFDKLGLEAELKGMEDMAQNHNLAELQAIATTLENIMNDSSVLNVARQRARRLLAQAGSPRD